MTQGGHDGIHVSQVLGQVRYVPNVGLDHVQFLNFNVFKLLGTSYEGLNGMTSIQSLLDKIATAASGGAQYGDCLRLVAFALR